MTKLRRSLLALAVGALAALAPAAAAQATGNHGKATLTGERACRPDGTWTATFTFTNKHKHKQAVITDVWGNINPAVPIVVEPGASTSATTAAREPGNRFAVARVTFSWRKPTPASPPPVTTTPPQPPVSTAPSVTPPTTLPPVSVPPTEQPPPPVDTGEGTPPAEVTAATDRTGSGQHTKSTTLTAVVWNRCPSPTQTTQPPTTTRPPTSPTATAPPSEDPEPTATADPPPPGDGEGGGNLPVTGPKLAFAVAGGAALVAAGVAAVVLFRRRSPKFIA